jgi:hypothetical protein
MNSTPARIVVELVPGATPITGRAHATGRESRSFTGWTGLFAALRALAADDAPPVERDVHHTKSLEQGGSS